MSVSQVLISGISSSISILTFQTTRRNAFSRFANSGALSLKKDHDMQCLHCYEAEAVDNTIFCQRCIDYYRKEYLAEFRRTNPLGIFCLECGEVCHLSDDGKRWLCKIEAHN
jgi:hypothetical protein